MLRNLAIFTKPNVWSVLTTPGSTAYHPLWSIAIIYETGGNAILLLFSLVLDSLFFARLKAFVPLMMAYMVLLALFLWGDLLVGQQIPAVSAHSDGKELFSAVQATVTAVIWIPYFLTSVRVRHTFVK